MPRYTMPRVAHCDSGQLAMVYNPYTAIADIQRTVHTINTKVDQIMSEQSQLDADVQAIAQAVTDLGTAATAIENEIAALKQSNPALDLTALDSAVASLKTSVSTIAAIPAS